MLIKVTADDICKGVRQDGAKCPIALAVCRALGVTESSVDVGGTEEGILSVDEDNLYYLPDEVVNFYLRFDNGELVEPFEFELDEPHKEFDEDSEP